MGIARGDERQAIPDNRRFFELIGHRRADEPRIKPSQTQRFRLLKGGHVAETNLHTRCDLTQPADQAGHQFEGVEAEPDSQAPAFTASQAPSAVNEPFKSANNRSGFLQELFSRTGQLGAVPPPLEKSTTQIFLDATDLFGERWLTEVQ